MAVRAIRGATQLDVDEADHLFARVGELISEVIEANALTHDDIISILLTATADVHSAFPAAAARAVGLTDVPLICARELEIEGSLPRAVRLMAHVESPRSKAEVIHVYQYGAVVLRPDLVRSDD